MLKGIDVSNWQSGLKPSALDVDFCIAKATEGIGYTDRSCDGFVQDCISNGLLWGFYHFARNNNPEDEAEWFVRETRNYFTHGIPILDYEVDNSDNRNWCERFINRVHELTGVWCVLYVSAYRVPQYNGSWIPEKCGLWIAGYPYDATYWRNADLPYSVSPWAFAAIWQFTSSLQLAGYDHNLDGNYAYMDADAWLKYAKSTDETGKSTDDLAIEVILGEYGTGEDRKRLLGARYDDVQKRVNEYYARAHEVLEGKWGNGWNREQALSGAGYDYKTVQRIVNNLVWSEGNNYDGC